MRESEQNLSILLTQFDVSLHQRFQEEQNDKKIVDQISFESSETQGSFQKER
jgi:hypothetical protein